MTAALIQLQQKVKMLEVYYKNIIYILNLEVNLAIIPEVLQVGFQLEKYNPIPIPMLQNADFILMHPPFLRRSWVTTPGPIKYFLENEYFLKTDLSCPIMIRGPVAG